MTKRREYTAEFKIEAIKLVKETGQPVDKIFRIVYTKSIPSLFGTVHLIPFQNELYLLGFFHMKFVEFRAGYN